MSSHCHTFDETPPDSPRFSSSHVSPAAVPSTAITPTPVTPNTRTAVVPGIRLARLRLKSVEDPRFSSDDVEQSQFYLNEKLIVARLTSSECQQAADLFPLACEPCDTSDPILQAITRWRNHRSCLSESWNRAPGWMWQRQFHDEQLVYLPTSETDHDDGVISTFVRPLKHTAHRFNEWLRALIWCMKWCGLRLVPGFPAEYDPSEMMGAYLNKVHPLAYRSFDPRFVEKCDEWCEHAKLLKKRKDHRERQKRYEETHVEELKDARAHNHHRRSQVIIQCMQCKRVIRQTSWESHTSGKQHENHRDLTYRVVTDLPLAKAVRSYNKK